MEHNTQSEINPLVDLTLLYISPELELDLFPRLLEGLGANIQPMILPSQFLSSPLDMPFHGIIIELKIRLILPQSEENILAYLGNLMPVGVFREGLNGCLYREALFSGQTFLDLCETKRSLAEQLRVAQPFPCFFPIK